MIPVVTPEQMRAIDAAADDPVATLIERAGSAVARVAVDVMGGAYGRRVTVVAGPGNNGADGRVAAERLRERGVVVDVVEAIDVPPSLPPTDLVVDAAFGTGFHGTWRPSDVAGTPVLAVDGLTGIAAPDTLRADATITFAAPKPGHVLGDGPDHVGELHVADIGLEVGSATIRIVDGDDVAAWWPQRARTAHKWADAVRIIAGSAGMTGAAYLSAAAAQRSGSGMVVLSSPGVDGRAPVEVVERALPPIDWADEVLADLHRFHALVIGPGLGRHNDTVPSIVRSVAESVVPVVVDGDGLFAMSWNDAGTPAFLLDREVATVLTPHDGEYALLIGDRPGHDRIAAAEHLVERSGAVVLLKGPTTVVAAPERPTLLVVNGDERLATAGTGDVLAGLIGTLLAAGVEPQYAAAAAAYVHAEAASAAGRAGLIASDLIDALPLVLARVKEGTRA